MHVLQCLMITLRLHGWSLSASNTSGWQGHLIAIRHCGPGATLSCSRFSRSQYSIFRFPDSLRDEAVLWSNRMWSQSDDFVPQSLLLLFLLKDLLLSFSGDAVGQEFFEIIIVDNATNLVCGSFSNIRFDSKPEVTILSNPIRNTLVLVSQSHSILLTSVDVVATKSSCHLLEILQVTIIKESIIKSAFLKMSFLLVFFLWGEHTFYGIKMSSFLLAKLTEITIRNVTFITSVHVLEDIDQFVNLEFNSHVVKTLLELVETYSVVKVDIKIPVSFMDWTKSFANLDPKQIEDSFQRTTLVFSCFIASSVTTCSVWGQHKPHGLGFISLIGSWFLWQVKE